MTAVILFMVTKQTSISKEVIQVDRVYQEESYLKTRINFGQV